MSEDGAEVRYGSHVSTSILRQVEPGQASRFETITEYAMKALGGVLLFLLILMVGLGESLLSIWIFTTSLTLIVHTIVFSATVPDDAFVVLRVMLKFLRIDFYSLSTEGQLSPTGSFVEAGYTSTLFVTNMGIPLLAIAACPVALWICTLFIDLWCTQNRANRPEKVTKCCRKSWCKIMVNVTLRILFVLLLEISICAMLEIHGRFIQGDDTYNNFTSQLKFWSVVAVLTIPVVILIVLFFCLRDA